MPNGIVIRCRTRENTMAKRKRKTISQQLRLAIENSGKTQLQLATEAGVQQGQLSRFMSGERSLNLDTVDKLCMVLELDLT